MQLDTVNVAGNASAIIGGPGLIEQGLGQRRLRDRRRDDHRQRVRQPLRRDRTAAPACTSISRRFENVEVATGGSILEQQTSGVTINVVTKRGTNQLKGSARYLYASANWQSTNTPQEAVDLGPADEQHAIHPRVRRGARRADPAGPALALGRGLAAGHLPRIRPRTFRGDVALPADDDPRAVEREAERPDLERQLRGPLLPEQQPARVRRRQRRPDRPPETRTNDVIPTSFYKVEDSNVFSCGPLRVGLRELPETPPARVLRSAASTGTCSSTTTPGTTPGQYLDSSEPQKQANLQVSKFFNTGRINHELKFSFNYRQQIADSASGLPGSQNAGGDDTFNGSSPGSRSSRAACAESSRRSTGAARSATRSPRAI